MHLMSLIFLAASTTAFVIRDTSSCPLYLPADNYEFPHLIVPFANTTTSGTSYFATISNTTSTAFNFDIPDSRAGQKCTLQLSLPRNDQLVTSHIDFTPSQGDKGALSVQRYKGTPTQETTGQNQPEVYPDGSAVIFQLGLSYTVWEGDCVPGVMSWRLSTADGTYLKWFQDWNDCAVGLWVLYGQNVGGCGVCPDVRKISHQRWMAEIGMVGAAE